MSILDKITRLQIVKLVQSQNLKLYTDLARNLEELDNNPIFSLYSYSDKVIISGIMYAMKRNNWSNK